MRIADICTRHVFHVVPSVSVRQAAEQMRKYHVGALVVVGDRDGKSIPVGMVTDRDIVVSVVALGIDTEALMVGDVMSTFPATCQEHDDVIDAVETMRLHGIRRLPVLDAKGSLVGIVTSDDVIVGLTRTINRLSSALVREQVRETRERSSPAAPRSHPVTRHADTAR